MIPQSRDKWIPMGSFETIRKDMTLAVASGSFVFFLKCVSLGAHEIVQKFLTGMAGFGCGNVPMVGDGGGLALGADGDDRGERVGGICPVGTLWRHEHDQMPAK